MRAEMQPIKIRHGEERRGTRRVSNHALERVRRKWTPVSPPGAL
jgi:hypothetical protein